jgi:hypothetical protein
MHRMKKRIVLNAEKKGSPVKALANYETCLQFVPKVTSNVSCDQIIVFEF